MFKRQIQLNVVKTPKQNDNKTIEDVLNPDEKAEAIKAMVGFASIQVAKVVVAVMVADAARKIAVNRLSK